MSWSRQQACGVDNPPTRPPLVGSECGKMLRRLWTNRGLWSCSLPRRQELREENLVRCDKDVKVKNTHRSASSMTREYELCFFVASYQGHCWSVTRRSLAALPPLGLWELMPVNLIRKNHRSDFELVAAV